jgi:putative pyruvate formate lyase activating enzyme
MAKKNPAGYVALNQSGELAERIDRAFDLLRPCRVCPRNCGVNRRGNERGFCKTALRPVISGCGPHFGEEPPLLGGNGSGTIFVSHCNLACEFCQNYDISQCGRGNELSCEEFAGMMVRLQNQGCHNVNIVTPTHVVPQMMKAVKIAADQGLTIPIVYNSGGYDAVQTLQLLEGIVDIYMPDAKYADDDIALTLSHAPNYVATMHAAIREMHRQAGDLVIEDGIAVRGLIIRHLVLPENLAGSDRVLPWIAGEISRNSYVNIMDQYHPSWHTHGRSDLSLPLSLQRKITPEEYRFAIKCALDSGLHRGF